MRHKPIFPLLVLFLALPSSFQQESLQREVFPNYQQNLEIVNDNTPKFYKIDLFDLPDETDISISLQSVDNLAPEMYVSTTNHNPKDSSTADESALQSQGGIIWIPYNKMRDLTDVYLGVVCPREKCTGDLAIEFSKEIVATTDGIIHRYGDEIKGSTSAVIRLYVPDTPNANRIVIHADAIPTHEDIIPSLKMFINKGKQIPNTNFAEIIPRNGWFEGKTAVIYAGTELFGTDTDYTISLKYNNGTFVSFQATVMENDAKLSQQFMIDALQEGKINTYKFEVSEDLRNEDIVIDVSPQKGILDVEVGCGTESSEHSWMFTIDKKKEDIVLTSEEHSICGDNPYHIEVKSNDPAAVYSIRALTRDSTNMYLIPDEPAVGRIEPGEVVEYDLPIPLFAMETIEIWLNTTGKINISLLNCKFSNDCPSLIPEEEGENEESDFSDVGGLLPTFNYDTKIYEGQGQLITIDPHNGGCYPILVSLNFMDSQTVPICAYHITITSEDSGPADYILTAIPRGHNFLQLGIPALGVISAGETAYYILDNTRDDVNSVTFQLTVFSGSAQIFASRTEKFPTWENSGEVKLKHEGFLAFDNTSNLMGSYYIAVQADEITSFSLTPTAYDKNGATEDFAILLEEGTPHKGVLLPKLEFPAQFYKINVALDDNWEGALEIKSVTLQGRIRITAWAVISEQDESVSEWASSTGTLTINSTDADFIRNGTYYIGIFVDWEDPDAYTIQELTFYLTYHLLHQDPNDSGVSNKNPIVLTSFFPQHGIIRSGHTLYFKVFILPSDQSITLFKQADSGDVDLYVSVSTHNPYPDATNYNYSTQTTHSSQITLNADDLQAACKDKVDNKLCEINFAAITTSPHEISFSISVTRETGADSTEPVALEDGKQSIFNIPDQAKPAVFYYYPAPQKDAFIEVSCPHKDIRIYANRRPVIVNTGNTKNKDIPTSDAFDFASAELSDLEPGFAHLMIPADSDSGSSIITLIVEFKDSYRASKDSDTDSKSFTIVASSSIAEMYTGKPILSHVAKDTYQYYFVNVHKTDCNLLISLTSLDDGDPDLLVSQGWIFRPTLEDHSFASISKQGIESLRITPLDIYPKKSMEGIWVIAVYGRSESRFALTVVYEDQSIIELHHGVPLEMYIAADSKMYFKYQHTTETDFDINIDQQSGDMTAYVKVVPEGGSIDSNVPTAQDYTWSINPNRDSALKVTSDKCTKCLILIGLEMKQSSKFLITILEEQAMARIQNSNFYQNTLSPKQSKKYVFFTKNFEEVDLNVDLKSGSVGVYVSNNPTANRTIHLFDNYLTTNSPTYRLELLKDDFKNAPQVIWDGTEEVVSLRDAYFIAFENEGDVPTKYSFSVNSKEGTAVLKLGTSQDFDFNPLQKKTFLYYSPHVRGVTTLELSYCTVTTKPEDDKEKAIMYSQVSEGFDIQIRFWAQKVTAGAGEEISELKNDIFIDSEEEQKNSLLKICLKQIIVIDNEESQDGKYEFILKNTLAGHTVLALRVDTTEVHYKVFERNTRYIESLNLNEVKDFEVIMPHRGTWYFSLFSCQGKLQVIVGDSPEAIDTQESEGYLISGLYYPKEYSYHVSVETAGVKYIRIKGIETESEFDQEPIQFLIVSSFFLDNKVYDYSTANPKTQGVYDPKMGHDYNYDKENSQLTIHFNPIAVSQGAIDDQLVFIARLCPKEAIPHKDNYCVLYDYHEECRPAVRLNAGMNGSETLVQEFSEVEPGNYYVHVYGSVLHEGETLMPFALRAYEMELKEPVTSVIMDYLYPILIVLGVLLCVLLTYRAVRRASAGKKGSSRNYDFVQEELE